MEVEQVVERGDVIKVATTVGAVLDGICLLRLIERYVLMLQVVG